MCVCALAAGGAAAQNVRTRVLNDQFAAVRAQHEVTYVDTFNELIAVPVWSDEVNAGDGSHPSGAGYERLTDIVFPPWWRWLVQ